MQAKIRESFRRKIKETSAEKGFYDSHVKEDGRRQTSGFSASASDLGIRDHMHSANPSAYENLKRNTTVGKAFWSGKITSIRPPS